MIVVKRDGRKQEFDKSKVINAIELAYNTIDGEITKHATDKAKEITKYIESIDKNELSVEEIQDIVEEKLMASQRKDVAKAYILYRDKRTKIREQNTQFIKTVSEKINAKNVKNQNANVDEKSFGGRVGETSDELMRKYAIDYLLSDKSKYNHLNNRIYIHDLNSYAVGNHNCLTIPIDKLLANGFNTRQTDVRPANSVNTACQLIAVIMQIQSLQQFGGVSVSHIDWSLVPYVRKSFWKHFKDGLKYIELQRDDLMSLEEERIYYILEHNELSETPITSEEYKHFEKVYKYAYDMTVKEIYQAIEGMFHNLNTLQSRSGNQLPFSSINYGTCTLEEGRLVTKAILETSIKGIGKMHRTSIFPCQIFQVMKGVNKEPNTPNYDLYRMALRSTAQRLYPNYANVDWSTNDGYDINDPRTYVSTMGKV